jgi:hypothetical protein
MCTEMSVNELGCILSTVHEKMTWVQVRASRTRGKAYFGQFLSDCDTVSYIVHRDIC